MSAFNDSGHRCEHFMRVGVKRKFANGAKRVGYQASSGYHRRCFSMNTTKIDGHWYCKMHRPPD